MCSGLIIQAFKYSTVSGGKLFDLRRLCLEGVEGGVLLLGGGVSETTLGVVSFFFMVVVIERSIRDLSNVFIMRKRRVGEGYDERGCVSKEIAKEVSFVEKWGASLSSHDEIGLQLGHCNLPSLIKKSQTRTWKTDAAAFSQSEAVS